MNAAKHKIKPKQNLDINKLNISLLNENTPRPYVIKTF